MVESDCRLNVVVQQLIDQVVVVVHSSLVLVSNTRGQHSGPGNGESVALQTQVCQQLNILFVERISFDNNDRGWLTFAGLVITFLTERPYK